MMHTDCACTRFAIQVYLITLLLMLSVASAAASGKDRGDRGLNPQSLSLADAYFLARDSDPVLAIAKYRVDGTIAGRDVARGEFFPQVSLFGDWSQNKVRYQNSALSQLPSLDYPGERYGLQLRTPLLDMRSFREYERQSALVEQSESELAVAEAELLAGVVEAYLLVLLTDETAAQLESELSALDGQLEEANALYAKSLLPVTQVLETQTRTDRLRADVVNARGQALVARERLMQIVGLRDFTPPLIAARIPLVTAVRDVDDAADLAVRFDPAAAAAEKSVNAAKKAIAREKGSWWPEVDFVYNAQYSDVGFDNLTSPPRSSETYSISVRYPLFEGGAGSARLRGAWAEFYSAQQQLEAARRDAAGRARLAWVNLETSAQRVLAARQAVKTAEVALDASRQAVKAGAARVTDVLLSLAQNTRAKKDLSEARFQSAMAWLELELSTGGDPLVLAAQLSKALHNQ